MSENEEMPFIDDAATRRARRRSIAEQLARRGRLSTILTDDTIEPLGGGRLSAASRARDAGVEPQSASAGASSDAAAQAALTREGALNRTQEERRRPRRRGSFLL